MCITVFNYDWSIIIIINLLHFCQRSRHSVMFKDLVLTWAVSQQFSRSQKLQSHSSLSLYYLVAPLLNRLIKLLSNHPGCYCSNLSPNLWLCVMNHFSSILCSRLSPCIRRAQYIITRGHSSTFRMPTATRPRPLSLLFIRRIRFARPL